MNALRDEKRATLDSIEAEYKGQLAGLRRDAETEEQKLAEQWAYKHLRIAKLLEQMGCQSRLAEPNGGC
ncbi:Transcription factor AS1 [Capsicum baccatum]|uniref:Transcription factor AS1 n=1 Tax=Capsicum baccatum TaxID=33114 RepID=A0A2G2VX88_CAPBA|nr:Transcription factor AS1 [Capsicum baccatum]